LPWLAVRMWLSSVVLPAPRKPVSTVTGTRGPAVMIVGTPREIKDEPSGFDCTGDEPRTSALADGLGHAGDACPRLERDGSGPANVLSGWWSARLRDD